MSVTTTLTHCHEVTVYSNPPDPPFTGAVTVTTGGVPGDGSVRVTTTPPSSVPPVVPTGSTSAPFDGVPLTEIRMHYMAGPGKPQSVDVTIDAAGATSG